MDAIFEADREREEAHQGSSSYVPLFEYDGGLGWNSKTRALLASIGGSESIIAATTEFYSLFYADKHLRQFLGDMHTPLSVHARRLGMYIAEMMGDAATPWTIDTATNRPASCPVKLAGSAGSIVVNSRQNAHWAAWHAVTRAPQKVGRRFKLDDCRVWMRLFFLAFRRVGLDQHEAFFSYLVRFIGHFIAIYETSAQRFARHESRWSLDTSAFDRYVAAGCIMTDVVDVPLAAAAQDLHPSERAASRWPWERSTSSGPQ